MILDAFSDKRLFELKRKEQVETAERVLKVDDYAHQYKTVNYLMDAIFPVSSLSSQVIIRLLHFSRQEYLKGPGRDTLLLQSV